MTWHFYNCCYHSKNWTVIYNTETHPKEAEGMANSVDLIRLLLQCLISLLLQEQSDPQEQADLSLQCLLPIPFQDISVP